MNAFERYYGKSGNDLFRILARAAWNAAKEHYTNITMEALEELERDAKEAESQHNYNYAKYHILYKLSKDDLERTE